MPIIPDRDGTGLSAQTAALYHLEEQLQFEATMAFSFTLADVIPATPQQIYDAWLSTRGHTRMTGSAARAKPEQGASFSAWGGYIKGKNLALEPGRRIVQSWRTTKFTRKDPDSQIEVLLEAVADGTRITLHHTNVPDGHTGYQDGGWQQHYFEPMKHYFADDTD